MRRNYEDIYQNQVRDEVAQCQESVPRVQMDSDNGNSEADACLNRKGKEVRRDPSRWRIGRKTIHTQTGLHRDSRKIGQKGESK